MPEITFILPHWIYWGCFVIAVPAFLMWSARRTPARDFALRPSLRLAYFLWLVGGFTGLHRLYLKSWWAGVFIALFVAVIICNQEARLTRNAHSIARNDVVIAQFDITRAQEDEETPAVIAALEEQHVAKAKSEKSLAAKLQDWHDRSLLVAVIIFVLLLVDALLLPRALRRAQQKQRAPPPIPLSAKKTAPTDGGAFTRWVSWGNGVVGEFVSYWTVVAVFVFYYEVIARYIFNSPTIWAHESMYLLFGMQYMLAGGFCLRENAHVRVDVIYLHLSARGRAIADLCTSVLFFIFVLSLLGTGWIFFADSYAIRESSFTEWAVAHWPIKFALPLGGFLIALQGAVFVLRDIALLRETGRSKGG